MFLLAIPPLLAFLGISGISKAATECGISQVSGRIMGGQDAAHGEWPWQVSLRDVLGRHFCGGSLITNKWVVSAAHCITNPSSFSSVVVFLGSYKLSQTNQQEIRVAVVNMIRHPSYDKNLDVNDISLLELEKEVAFTNYINPVCLPDPAVKFPTGLKCWATGWGAILPGVSLPNPKTLQEVALPIIDIQTCSQYYNTPSNKAILHPDFMICAGYINGGKDSCQGDSGGPLVCSENNRWFLGGVVSFGDSCGKPYRPGVYTLLTPYISWINSIVPNVSTNVRDVQFTGNCVTKDWFSWTSYSCSCTFAMPSSTLTTSKINLMLLQSTSPILG
ncbi:hypothetical protein XELAEV_18001595mg [Xenopus laevis]|nr:hypothetical protein XELAEV_18001595mg [Xenopus laevis]